MPGFVSGRSVAPNGCGLRRSFRTCASRTRKRGGALAAPPEEHKRPRVVGSRYSSFISKSLLLSQQFTRAAHCLSVQNCTILKSVGGSRRAVHCSRNQAPGASPGGSEGCRSKQDVKIFSQKQPYCGDGTPMWALGRVKSQDHGRFKHESSVVSNCPGTRFTSYRLC